MVNGVIEFLGIVRVVVLCFICVILLFAFNLNYVRGFNDMLQIFSQVNVITATLVVTFSPVLRNLLSGLTILVDRSIRVGQSVEIFGVAPAGVVVEVQLQESLIRAFVDNSTHFVPNVLFTRYAIVNYSARTEQAVKLCLPLKKDTDPAKIRKLLIHFAMKPRYDAAIDDKFNLRVSIDGVPAALYVAEKTELMLEVVDWLGKQQIGLDC